MKLLVHELQDEVYQTITPSRNEIVEAIRPHLYKHNFPSGSVVVEVHDNIGCLIAQSDSINIADISDANFYHGYIRFYIKAYLKAGTTYRVVIKAQGGYTFSESAYLGVCNSFDFATYPASYEPSLGVNSPLDIQVWTRK